jgi:hypothetical protein
MGVRDRLVDTLLLTLKHLHFTYKASLTASLKDMKDTQLISDFHIHSLNEVTLFVFDAKSRLTMRCLLFDESVTVIDMKVESRS